MAVSLRHDAETGELLLVMADLWDGQHERTEFRVANGDGKPLTGHEDMDGRKVLGRAGDWYVKTEFGVRIPVRVMPGERAEVQRTPCPKATSPRRKCALCAAQKVA